MCYVIPNDDYINFNKYRNMHIFNFKPLWP